VISELEEIENFVEPDETEELDDSTGIITRFDDKKYTYFSWHDDVRGHYATGITRKIAIRSYFDSIIDIISSLSLANEEMKHELNEMSREISGLICMDDAE